METSQIQQLLLAHANSNSISVEDVEFLLAATKGVTFAQIAQVTQVSTAAAHKAMDIKKITIANVQLFNNLNEFTHVYQNAVRKHGFQEEAGGPDPKQFVPSENYYKHTSCYSIVQHKEKEDQFYLYAIYNAAESAYTINGHIATKEQVAQYLTKSAATALLHPTREVYNKTNDITHTVQVRTTKLENIVSIKAMKQQVSV
jgi:hypothetical protein